MAKAPRGGVDPVRAVDLTACALAALVVFLFVVALGVIL